MDLIYTNAAKEDQGVLFDYEFDLAFGADENTFECTIPAEKHCCEAGSFLYIEGTEYGGIVDSIKVNTEQKTITYIGRTWHGILEGAVIQPLKGETEVEVEEQVPVEVNILPDGYQMLDYIQSSGTQYIDTGIVGKTGIKTSLDFAIVSGDLNDFIVIGCAPVSYSPRFYPVATQSGKWAYGYSAWSNSTVAAVKDSRYAITTELNTNGQSMKVDGSAVASGTTATSVNIGIHMFLFGANVGGTYKSYGSVRVYACKIYENGEIVRDFVPCINPSGEVGLYDLVTAAFFGNSGSGNFIAGAIPADLPDGYTQVDFIESSGKQYIDTGFKPNQDTRVVLDFEYLSGHIVFGAFDAGEKNPFALQAASGKWYTYYGTSNGSGNVSVAVGARVVADINKNVSTINGTVLRTATANTFSGSNPIIISGLYYGNAVDLLTALKIYSCQIYDNGTLVREFVPCKNPGGEIGLYDLVNDQFYGNSGTGTFTVGAEVTCKETTTIIETVITTKTIFADYDYYVAKGEGNAVLAGLIEYLGLTDIFTASEEDSGIHVATWSFRYVDAYSGICQMLAEYDGKLKFKHNVDKVILYTEPLMDFSQDEEFDSSQVDFTVQKNFRPVNHLICLGQGDLKDRHVIHLFTDENGGVQPYKTTENPVEDTDYILDQSGKLLSGMDEVAEVLNYPNAQTAENFVKLSVQPLDWASNYANYFVLNDSDDYAQVKGIPSEEIAVLTAQPEDWADNYASYFHYVDGELRSVEAVTTESYKILSKKPVDWETNYKNYFVYWSDGVDEGYNPVVGINETRYVVQTRRPTDWATNYASYFHRDITGKYFNVKADKGEEVPSWVERRVYTAETYNVAPEWTARSRYYAQQKTTSVPFFVSGTYYSRNDVLLTPSFLPEVTFRKAFDHYAELVERGLERLKKSFNCDSVDIDLDLEGNYDIGDIVGASEHITGIAIWQPITKKIVTIKDGRITISYKVGD